MQLDIERLRPGRNICSVENFFTKFFSYSSKFHSDLLLKVGFGPGLLTEISWISVGIWEWKIKYIHVKQWDKIINTCHNYNGGLVEAPFKDRDG